MLPYQFNTDCEGPISKNDNAQELANYFIPEGNKFFSLISKYDDYLADIAKKSGYKAGDTLKLILPFLKAYGATNREIEEYSASNILLVPGAKESLSYIVKKMPSFIISTSYEPYIYALCEVIDFPKENVYCTQLDIDKYVIYESEITLLIEITEEILALPMIELPPEIKDYEHLSPTTKKTIQRLDEIFWQELLQTKSGEMLIKINPIGGLEKANAVKDSLKRTGNDLCGVMYVGDSITDVQALNLVRGNGGGAISFNGNRYALEAAEFACISGHTIATAILAEIFSKGGKEALMELCQNWHYSTLKNLDIEANLLSQLLSIYPKNLPIIETINDSNRERLIKESESFRITVRGEVVGKLG